ncbi:hypothetical protein ACOACO_03530 [Nocardioides sp. CPCC 205120]|uniref:hypothetical protein n=1 Tax=Nocardioides sp. CPCC 205120 TaxID=3406462 RepID=UPI003B503CBE
MSDPTDPRRDDRPAGPPPWEDPGPPGYGAGIGGRRPPNPKALLVALLITVVLLPVAAWFIVARTGS